MKGIFKSFAIAGATAAAIGLASPAQAYTSLTDADICSQLDAAPHTAEGFANVVLNVSDTLDRGFSKSFEMVQDAVFETCPEHVSWIRKASQEGTTQWLK